jgi:hypothetical protein
MLCLKKYRYRISGRENLWSILCTLWSCLLISIRLKFYNPSARKSRALCNLIIHSYTAELLKEGTKLLKNLITVLIYMILQHYNLDISELCIYRNSDISDM